MKTLGYYNGKIGELENMTVPFNDRACFFGDGVYDAAYCHNYHIHALDEHLERFFNSAKALNINVPVSPSTLAVLLQDLVKQVDIGDQFVYWQVTRGTAERNHTYPSDMVGNLWVALKEGHLKVLDKKLRCRTAEDTRYYHCNIKTINLIPNVIAAEKTEELGLDETIFHRGNRITECAHSNVSMLKNGVFITPPSDNLILSGIARSRIIKMCKTLGITVSKMPFSLEELLDADEIIISSAGSLCLSVAEIDGKNVGGKAPILLKKLQNALLNEFLAETEGKNER